MSTSIRASKDTEGIQVRNEEIKLSQYADDTTAFFGDESSLGNLLDLLGLYGDCSRLRLNQSRSEAMWLGKNLNRKDTPFGINCALGRFFFL